MYLSLNFTQDPYAHLSPSNTSFTPLHACLFIYLSIHLSSFPSIPRHLLILVSPLFFVSSSYTPSNGNLKREEEKRKIGREGLSIYTIDNYNRMEREKRDEKIRVISGMINRLRCEGYCFFLCYYFASLITSFISRVWKIRIPPLKFILRADHFAQFARLHIVPILDPRQVSSPKTFYPRQITKSFYPRSWKTFFREFLRVRRGNDRRI